MDDLLTTQQAAVLLGISDTRVRQLILDGKLPALKFGRANLIKRSDLKLVANRKVGRPPKPKEVAVGKKKAKKK